MFAGPPIDGLALVRESLGKHRQSVSRCERECHPVPEVVIVDGLFQPPTPSVGEFVFECLAHFVSLWLLMDTARLSTDEESSSIAVLDDSVGLERRSKTQTAQKLRVSQAATVHCFDRRCLGCDVTLSIYVTRDFQKWASVSISDRVVCFVLTLARGSGDDRYSVWRD